MAYTRKNKLTLIITIQEITLEHTSKGISQEWVYKNLIFPTYRFSKRTYYTYLSTPAKAEIKKFHTKVEQLKMFA